MMRLAPFLSLLALFGGACALAEKAEVIDARYFTPPGPTAVVHAAPRATPLDLELGRVTASSHLRNRIAYRESNVEIGFYEFRRWTERPDEYVRRALSRALFDESSLTPMLGGDAPVLDVDVVAFEEVRKEKARFGRVTLRWTLHDDTRVLGSESVTIEEQTPNDSAKPEDVVRAIGTALDRASAAIAAQVVVALSSAKSAPREASDEKSP